MCIRDRCSGGMRRLMKEEKTRRMNSAQDAHQLENLTTMSFLTHNKGNCPQDVCSTRSYTERILLRSTDERVSSSALMFHNHRFCTMAKSHNIIREGIPGKKIFQRFLAYRTVLTPVSYTHLVCSVYNVGNVCIWDSQYT